MANYSLLTCVAFFSLVSNFGRNLLYASKPYDAIAVDDSDWINTTATWYGLPYGSGGPGVCLTDQDVIQSEPYNSLTAAVASPLFQNNFFPNNTGCQKCYQIRCSSPHCSGKPVVVSAIDYLQDSGGDRHLFDLSGCSISALANPGEADQLRSGLGFLDIQYKSTECNYEEVGVTFKVGLDSNDTYFTTSVECENGADIVAVSVKQANSTDWIEMAPVGAYFAMQFNASCKLPWSFKMQTSNAHIVVVTGAIPQDYTRDATYLHKTIWSPTSSAVCHK